VGAYFPKGKYKDQLSTLGQKKEKCPVWILICGSRRRGSASSVVSENRKVSLIFVERKRKIHHAAKKKG
jgi:hypothetical protein